MDCCKNATGAGCKKKEQSGDAGTAGRFIALSIDIMQNKEKEG